MYCSKRGLRRGKTFAGVVHRQLGGPQLFARVRLAGPGRLGEPFDVEFAITDHTLGLMIHQGLPTLSTATQHRIAEAHRDISHEFARLYQEAMLAGQLRPIPPDLAGVFVQDVIMAAAKVLIRHPDPKERLHEVADEAVRFLFHGLSPVK